MRLCRPFTLPVKAYETLWSAREIASVALLAERERHTKNMFHIVLEIASVALLAERESATEAISLALHSVSQRIPETVSRTQ